MRCKKAFFANLMAEIVARFLVGSFVAVFCTLAVVPRIWRYDQTELRALLGMSAAVGVLYAVLGIRRGPGVI